MHAYIDHILINPTKSVVYGVKCRVTPERRAFDEQVSVQSADYKQLISESVTGGVDEIIYIHV